MNTKINKTMCAATRCVCLATCIGMASFLGLADGVENGEKNYDGITNIADSPALARSDKIILTVDQRGNLSSTNAIATSADLAAVAASNQLAIAIMEANSEGYKTATNLLHEVAESVATSPIVFCSAELSSFVAATVFDDATAKLRVFMWSVDKGVTATKQIVIDGSTTNIVCQRITCGYMFTEDIQSIKPLMQYVEHLEDNNNPSTWEYLNDILVDSPTPVAHEPYTDAAGTTFTDFYQVYIWIPIDRASGFFRVVVENSAADADGNTLDTVGVKNGYTGVVTIGDVTLNIMGGYILKNGTGNVSN